MSIKFRFDSSNTPMEPTIVLATRSGIKLGAIPAHNVVVKDTMASFTELVFCVYKELDGQQLELWDQIKDFKLVYCVEWDLWFEITVEINTGDENVKNISAKSLGEAELGQIMLYNIEINTETDILRDDYSPTLIYNAANPSASLLHRIMEKAPHYTIKHVDANIAIMQRTFTFDSISLYDAFQEIATELNCIFSINSGSNESGDIAREISVYDLESHCLSCGYRGEFLDVCPECGSLDILTGYGEDTSIFISVDNLAENITYSTDTGSVKNCFKLIAGDDLMTATITNCNPNGTGYIWYISDETKEDMSDELVARLEEYDTQYAYYQNEHEIVLPPDLVADYNALVTKYSTYENNFALIPDNIIGYPALMNAYYDTIDFYLYLYHGMMPEIDVTDITASSQASVLTKGNIPYISVQNLSSCSSATVSNAVLSFAKIFMKSGYQLRINEGVLSEDKSMWTGNFLVTNYKDENDTAISSQIEVPVNDNFEQYLGQRLKKELSKSADDKTDILGFFDRNINSNETDNASEFALEAKKYCLVRLVTFRDACQACLDILIENGAGNSSTWKGQSSNPYSNLYSPYRERINILNKEIALREAEIAVIAGTTDANGDQLTVGIQDEIKAERDAVQSILNFQDFMGEDLWLEFAAYRRDDSYQNDNYISDGLDNAELFNNALEFIDVAKREIFKSATLQHSITATLKNLLVMKEFRALLDSFEIGNWIRVKVDNETYRLRLIDCEINFDQLESIGVAFSDVKSVSDGISDIESILNQAASMSTSYGYVARQAEQGKNGSDTLSNWVAEGLDLTNVKIMSAADSQDIVWDKHGMLFREYDPVSETYNPCQLKIINSTMSITDDEWETVKTAIGKYVYVHPGTQKVTTAFGINAETLVGKFILGEYLGIYNETGSLSFDSDGFMVTNGSNSLRADPDPDDGIIFAVSNSEKDVLFIDEKGNVNIVSDYVSFTGSDGNMSFGADGLSVSNGTSTFCVNPKDTNGKLVKISTKKSGYWGQTSISDIFYVDKNGNLYVSGNITGTISGTGNDLNIESNSSVTNLNTNLSDTNTRVEATETNIETINKTINSITIATTGEGPNASIVLKSGDKTLGESATISTLGLVTFRNLGTAGETTIDGGNITTGSINADLIKTGKLNADLIQTGSLNASLITTGELNADIITVGTLNADKISLKTEDGMSGFSAVEGSSKDSNGNTYTTYGTKMFGSAGIDGDYYFMVTNAGAIQRAGSNYILTTDDRISASTSISTGSDLRMKNSVDYNVEKYEKFYHGLKPVSYKYNEESRQNLHIGFIAQDVHASLEASGLTEADFAGILVPTSEYGRYQLAYSEFIALNTHMIQKLMLRVEELENQIVT